MRIDILSNKLATDRFGGVARYIVELAKAINKTSNHVRLDAKVFQNEYLRRSCGELGHNGIFSKKFGRFAPTINSVLRSSVVGGRLRSDLTHSTFYERPSVGFRNAPSVLTVYDMIHEVFYPRQRFVAVKRKAFKRADRMIAISEHTKCDIVERWDADPDTIDVVHLASSIEDVIREPTWVSPTPAPYLLWVGSRGFYKNFRRFVQALPLTSCYQDGVGVVCAGGAGFSSKNLEDLHTSGVDPRRVVHVSPSEAELAGLYEHASMLVYASEYEGFGIPLLEAMQLGCPVVASDTSSMPEVAEDAAEYCDPLSCDSIATAIDSVYYDSTKRQFLIDRGRKRARRFSWKRCGEETIETYLKAIG
ncbi:MAG: glycosyltransferase family 1 protein [Planctomycetota bacterium]